MLHLFTGQHIPLGAAPRWIANPTGGPSHQRDGTMSSPLKVHQQHDRYQVANMQRIGGRVKTRVHSDFFALQQGIQPRNKILHQPSLLQGQE